MIPLELFFEPSLRKTKSRIHQFGLKMLPRRFTGYALNAGGGWIRDLFIADLHDIENNFPSEVTSLESRNCKNHSYIFAQMDPWNKKVTHKVKPYATKESRASTLERVPSTLSETRGDRLSAQGVTLCKKNVELRTFLKLIATLRKPRKISGVLLRRCRRGSNETWRIISAGLRNGWSNNDADEN